MSTTVAAALKRLTVKLLTDKRVFKIAGGIVLGIIVIIVMPIIVLLGRRGDRYRPPPWDDCRAAVRVDSSMGGGGKRYG